MSIQDPKALIENIHAKYKNEEDKQWQHKIEEWCHNYPFQGKWIFSNLNNLDMFPNSKLLFNFILWEEKYDRIGKKTPMMAIEKHFLDFSKNDSSLIRASNKMGKEEIYDDELDVPADINDNDSDVSLRLSNIEEIVTELKDFSINADNPGQLDQLRNGIDQIKSSNTDIISKINRVNQILDGLNDFSEPDLTLATKEELINGLNKAVSEISEGFRNEADKNELGTEFKDYLAIFGGLSILIIFVVGIVSISKFIG